MALLAWLRGLIPGAAVAPVPVEPDAPVVPVEPARTAAQAALLAELRGYLNDVNIRAMQHVVREGETCQTDEAYRWLFGSTRLHPKLFDSFADHPRQWFATKWGNTSAAGAYQAMCAVPGKVKTDTWGDFIKAVGPMDFSPPSQDVFCVWCYYEHGAVRDVIAGDFVIAVQKLNTEWASLPGSPYGQPLMTLNRAGIVFKQYGGSIRGG